MHCCTTPCGIDYDGGTILPWLIAETWQPVDLLRRSAPLRRSSTRGSTTTICSDPPQSAIRHDRDCETIAVPHDDIDRPWLQHRSAPAPTLIGSGSDIDRLPDPPRLPNANPPIDPSFNPPQQSSTEGSHDDLRGRFQVSSPPTRLIRGST